ncbi:sugar-binding domain-containing protein [Bacteroidota bacterium]
MRTMWIILLFPFLCFACNTGETERIDLAGEWRFKTDPTDVGKEEAWYMNRLNETVHLPGSMAENRKGDNISLSTQWTGDIQDPEWYTRPWYEPYTDTVALQFPFWLQPEKKYTGAAWYQKSIKIPGSWKGKIVCLSLERCHWETTVWLDDQKIGMENSLATPHNYILNDPRPGMHRITIRVDNRVREIDPGSNSHSISDHTQTNWNGIAGRITMEAKDPVFLEKLRIVPDIRKKSLSITADIMNTLDTTKQISLGIHAAEIAANGGQNFDRETAQIKLTPGRNEINLEYLMGEWARLWDEFDPALYRLVLEMTCDDEESVYDELFGLREIRSEAGKLTLNGRQLFLRGTLECAIFPKTGYPSTDTAEWRRIFAVIKAHGLNHMRFHSWCPPEAAFIAADLEGIYLQVECSSWANVTTTLGDGKPIDSFIWKESKRIVDEYGNHPSFCMLAYGNEPGGNNYVDFLSGFVTYWQKSDQRRIYTAAAGWPEIPQNDYHNIPTPRIQGWGEELRSVINGEPPSSAYDWHSRDRMPEDDIPVISHEIGQWCVYPNFDEIEKYTGVLKARNLELFRKSLNANGLGSLSRQFLMASGTLQALCYKADIEAALRTENMGGFQLLDLHDFPGQGTALVGILDPFWEEKGYITPEKFSTFCNSVVPLVRLEKMVFTEGEMLKADVEIANFSSGVIESTIPSWSLTDSEGHLLANGLLDETSIPIGNGIELGQILLPLTGFHAPQKLELAVSVSGFTNTWNIWVLPGNNNYTAPDNVLITADLNGNTLDALASGQNVLLSLGKGSVREGWGGEVGVGFSSIFWNTAWTRGQKPHTLGILCDPDHAALSRFPGGEYSDWIWWDALSHADAINIGKLDAGINPLVRIIDDWVTNRDLALIFEVRVGNGKLIVSGADLMLNMDKRPEARQLRISLCEYMSGDSFNPEVRLSPEQITGILNE